jgi:hypothetical protein
MATNSSPASAAEAPASARNQLPPAVGGVGMHQRLPRTQARRRAPAALWLAGLPSASRPLAWGCSAAVGPLEVMGMCLGPTWRGLYRSVHS